MRKCDLGKVLDLIGRRKLSEAERRTVSLKEKSKALNTAQQLYKDLYQARNDFIHGNELSPETFAPSELGRGVRLLDTASVVFHAALEAHALAGQDQHELIRSNGLEAGFERIYRSEEDELREIGEI